MGTAPTENFLNFFLYFFFPHWETPRARNRTVFVRVERKSRRAMSNLKDKPRGANADVRLKKRRNNL